MKVEERLKELGITLPPAPKAVGSYATSVQVGDMVYLSGTGGLGKYTGKVGSEVTIEQGYEIARSAVLNFLSTLRSTLGDLDRIEQIVKVNGYINCEPDFFRQPEVVNGASDLLIKIFGKKGTGARTAIGATSLPFNIPVELEMIVKIKND